MRMMSLLLMGGVFYPVIFKVGDHFLPSMPEQTSIEVLESRYSNGEIDEATYIEMHKIINS